MPRGQMIVDAMWDAEARLMPGYVDELKGRSAWDEPMTERSKNTDPAAWDLSQRFDFNGQEIRYGIIGEGDPIVLLDHWRLERPDVVAHDFGGATALRTHLLNGRDYRSLTLIDPVAIGPSGSPFVQAAKDNQEAFATLPAYIHEAILRAYIGGAVANALRDDEMQLYLDPWLGEEGQKAFYRQIAQMSDKFTDEIEHRYGEIHCPVSILWGEKDEWIPRDRGKELARRIPNARFRSVSEGRHLVQEDAPEAITATVLAFLARAG